MRYPTTRDAGPVLPWTYALLYHRYVGPTVRRPHHPCRRPHNYSLFRGFLGSYAALQLGLVQGQSYIYVLLNIVAACCVLFSLGQTFNLSSAIMIGNIRTGCYIGELTAMTDEPASATIRVTQPSRYFCIGVTELKQLISRNAVFRNVVSDSFFDDTKLKLIAQNRQHPNFSPSLRPHD